MYPTELIIITMVHFNNDLWYRLNILADQQRFEDRNLCYTAELFVLPPNLS